MSDFDRDGLGEEEGMPELSALDGEAGPALPLSPAAFALLVAKIEQQFTAPKPVLRLPRRFAPRRLVVGGTLLAASAAAAVYGVSAALSDRSDQPQTTQPSAGVVPELPPVEPTKVPQRGQAEAPVVVPPLDASGIRASGETASEETGGEAAAELPQPKAVVSRSAAADRLAAANALRAEHRYREAQALYLEVLELYPNSMQASVSRIAAAEIRLERFGDIDGAERLYREAKTKGGELTAEAQFGIAQVFRARSDAASERRALQEFVARHPESPLVSAARRRLQALGVQ